MNGSAEEQELKDRLSLIEKMIAEGRRTTESWGWTFVLWGVAYYVAIVWSMFGKSMVAWPVTMVGASVLMGVLISRKRGRQPGTTIGRAMSAIWVGMGISMFTVLMALGMSGRYDLTWQIQDFNDLFDGFRNEDIYFNTPMQYMANMHDYHILTAMRRIEIIIAIGETDPFLPNNQQFSKLLWDKGLPNQLYIWEAYAHRPRYWRQMVQLYL